MKLRTVVRLLAMFLWAMVGVTAWGGPMGGQSVSLAWDPSPDTNVVGYVLYYGTSSGNYSNRIDVGSVTNATVSGLKAGLVYYFVATAYNADGLESVPSNELAFLVPGIVKLMAAATPNSPASVAFPVAPGQSYILQASSDLKSWQHIWATTGTTNGWVQYADPWSPTFLQRFYRLILLNTGTVPTSPRTPIPSL